MISGARKLPTLHISIRVPWHDSGWKGAVCARPDLNTSCRALSRIAEAKDDGVELGTAGASLEDLDRGKLPPCVDERALFMAPFPFTQRKSHPYAPRNPDTYGHFRPTPYTNQPYSAACVPFRWMLSKNAPELSDQLDLDYDENREPDLGFDSAWIQERKNQLVMLDTFFGSEDRCQVSPYDTFFRRKARLQTGDSRRSTGARLARSRPTYCVASCLA